jgi:hypothetical protein
MTFGNSLLAFGLLMAVCVSESAAQRPSDSLDRTVLPITEPARQPCSELDVRKAALPARFAVTAPQGAPNVLLVLIDDLGFAGTSTFGGPVSTPTFDRIARAGLAMRHSRQ